MNSKMKRYVFTWHKVTKYGNPIVRRTFVEAIDRVTAVNVFMSAMGNIKTKNVLIKAEEIQGNSVEEFKPEVIKHNGRWTAAILVS